MMKVHAFGEALEKMVMAFTRAFVMTKVSFGNGMALKSGQWHIFDIEQDALDFSLRQLRAWDDFEEGDKNGMRNGLCGEITSVLT